MKNLKGLMETRNNLINQIEEITEKIQAEKRVFSNEETKLFDELMLQLQGIDETINKIKSLNNVEKIPRMKISVKSKRNFNTISDEKENNKNKFIKMIALTFILSFFTFMVMPGAFSYYYPQSDTSQYMLWISLFIYSLYISLKIYNGFIYWLPCMLVHFLLMYCTGNDAYGVIKTNDNVIKIIITCIIYIIILWGFCCAVSGLVRIIKYFYIKSQNSIT